MNQVYTSAATENKMINSNVPDMQIVRNTPEITTEFDEIHPITDMMIRSKKSVKLDNIVYYMVVMMVALVSLTVFFYSEMV